jgi:predicted dehydrogenase
MASATLTAEMATISLIGAGVIARFHAAAVRKLPGSYEIAVTDPNPAAIEEFTQQFPQARVFPDLVSMLAPRPAEGDIVVNATPPFGHCDPTIAALDSGRHVLCEKPLALSLDEARQMLAAAKKKGRRLGCCSMRFLALSTAAEAKRLVREDAIGAAYHVTWIHRNHRARSGIEYQPASRWFLDPAKNGGGVVMDWGPYDLAALVDLLEPTRVEVRSAWIATPRTAVDPELTPLTEHHAGASLIFRRSDGTAVPVTWERSSATHGREQKTHEIEGPRGSLTWDWLGGGKLTHCFDEAGKLVTQTREIPETTDLGPHDKPLVFMTRAIAGEPSPALLDERAVFNFAILRAIYDCARRNCSQIINMEDFA